MKKSLLKRFVIFALLWTIIVEGEPSALLIGVLVSAAAAALSIRLAPPSHHPVEFLSVIRLIPSFLLGSLRGGIDVAWRALSPRARLQPGWIEYPVRLPPGLARMSLGSELSLMPGMLCAGIAARSLQVHCLNYNAPVMAAIEREESRIARCIGMTLEARHG